MIIGEALDRSGSCTIEQWLELELKEGIRYEFHHGEVFAVAGGSISHARISSDSFFELESALRSKHADYETFTSEAKLEISTAGRYVYPDTLVICGDVIESKEVSTRTQLL